MNKTWKKINQRACNNSIWSWSPMPCEKHGPRASVTTKTSAFGLGFCLMSPRAMFFTRHGRPWSNPTLYRMGSWLCHPYGTYPPSTFHQRPLVWIPDRQCNNNCTKNSVYQCSIPNKLSEYTVLVNAPSLESFKTRLCKKKLVVCPYALPALHWHPNPGFCYSSDTDTDTYPEW